MRSEPAAPNRPGRARRICAAWLVAGLLLSLLLVPAACAKPIPSPSTSDGQLHILTSFLPIYVFTANLVQGIDGVVLQNMAAPETGCLHDYRLLPADMVKLESADLFIINGAGMEGFMGDLAQRRNSLPVVEASRGIDLLPGADGSGNPHVWLSVRLAIRQVRNISQGLQQADPTRAGQYQANEAAYVAQLQALDGQFRNGLATVHQKSIITFHEAFPYFAAEYGLTIAAVIEREPGSEPTAAELAATIDLVRAKQIKALFAEPQYSLKVAETIARETGATVYTLDPVVTGTLAADTYIRVMTANLQVLLKALQ